MADLKLFRIGTGQATELRSTSVALERSLQQLIERNMEEMFATRFLASEFLNRATPWRPSTIVSGSVLHRARSRRYARS